MQEAEEKKTKKKKRKTEHTESDLQRTCVAWFRAQYPKDELMLFAVPNGGGRSAIEAGIMKAEGVTAGVADLLLLEARGGWGCLCIEMKTKKKWSRQRDSQKAWQEATERAGNRYVVCRTLEEFQTVVADYMGLPAGSARRVVVRGDEMAAIMPFLPEGKTRLL
ncbi:MAG: VRR-NUC domain-containing protein [Bacteroidales bacterium]|nr:VRR-NUC domain-containing protein [Bacteroidales bacterium]